MIPGVRVDCIVGSVRIRDFSTMVEVLQAKVMTFVNQVAEIIHGVVDEFHGAANKNNGETFLLIWRTANFEPDQVSKFADMSVLAFTRILGAVHRSSVLATYRGHPGLQQRLGAQCRVSLSIGLHSGWAIEGAVGSEFKIDASYLSPNVSIAANVELATAIYEVPFMLTQTVVELMTKPMAEKCRLVDHVMISGCKSPMKIYSLDLDYLCLDVDFTRHFNQLWTTRWRFKARQFLESEKSSKLSRDTQMVQTFEGDPDIISMRRRYTVQFFRTFNMGYQNYSEGEWRVARRLLSDTRLMLRGVEDGPSAALLRFMEHPHNFEAPTGWAGIRELNLS
eukprot:gnl/TRDRNA2_/TRDRNA2_164576_c1_seq1.p1 gnl/TRDRNA2_/TRDRNA2_164576_c1~~gnl/TRDRNA2_/TRDRNA2_164576_c1_seq1.p1  ORF type:complete len:371 (+),score=43.69 gnl/TRDRNA2_/TRDRNA2_164576_c1_seq1:108-1115(+)